MDRRLLAAALAAVLAAAPAAQEARDLPPGVAVPRELSAGQIHIYHLRLARADVVHLTIAQQGIDVAAALADADGREVVAVDAMDDEFRPETLIAIAGRPGTYTLTIRPASPLRLADARSGQATARGRYSVRLDPPRTATAADESRVEAERAFARGRQQRDSSKAATWAAALADFEAARDRFHALSDRPGEMKALIEIAVTENYMSRAEALAPAQQAEAIAREIDDRPAVARVLRVLASVHALAGDLGAAARAVEEATLINRAIGNRSAEAHSLSYTASMYARRGDVEKALALNEQALPLARATGNRGLESTLLNNLGVMYRWVGEFEKALSMYERSLADARTHGDLRLQEAALSNLGGLHLKLGRPAKALKLRLQAVDVARRIGDPRTEARWLNAVGETYSEARNDATALDYHQQALAISRRLGDLSTQAWAMTGAGRALNRLGRDAAAVEALNEALALFRQTRERLGERDALAEFARAERSRGNGDAAIGFSRQAVDLDDALRAEITSPELRTAFVAAEQDKYELLIDLLQQRRAVNANTDDGAAALEVSERARARALLDSLLESRVDLREGITTELLDRERSLQKQLTDASAGLSRAFGGRGSAQTIAAAAQTVDRLTDEYQQLEARIRRESPHYASVTQPQLLTAAEIQRSVLDADTVLLEFALGEERSWLWAVTPERIASVELPSRQKIEAAARSVYERITARHERHGETAAAHATRVAAADRRLDASMAAMSRMLLGGIADRLNGEWSAKRLAIVPTGALQYLSFAVLPVPGRAATTPLVVEHEIVTIPSASVLARLRTEARERPPAAGVLAIVADPVFDRSDPRLVRRASNAPSSSTARAADLDDLASLHDGLERLPFSRDEANAIRSLAGSRQVFTALDFAANRTTVLGGGLRGHRIIHFATHGIVDSRRPALSGLILSLFDRRGTPQNGFLRLHDIYNTPIDADLVVLSACQTALGKEIKGEGLVSLTRAFMYAGARRVVASLWRVNDQATADLMRRFYRGILLQHLEPAAALRKAQRELARDPRWSAPYFWAGFVLQGDWQP